MKRKYELFYQVSKGITAAIIFCESMGLELLLTELEAAQKWLAGVGDDLSPQHSDEIADIVAILRQIAEIASDRESPFLAKDFERLAANITRCLESEQMEGKTGASL